MAIERKQSKYLFLHLLALTLGGCSATMTARWPDDYKMGKLKGGEYTYLNQGMGYFVHSRNEDGMTQANQWCGASRQPFIVNQHDSQSLSTEYQPTFSYTTGTTSFSSGGSATYSSTTQSGQWVTRTREYHSTTFLCPDSEPVTQTWALVYKDSPRCVSIQNPWTPGKARLQFLLEDRENEACVAEGWVRINSAENSRHLFFGDRGFSKCSELASQLIDRELTADKFSIAVRKALSRCGDLRQVDSPKE